MGRAKEIKVKVIPSKVAIPFVKKHHYSGRVVSNSQLHFGAFLDNKLHGVMSFGPSLDKRKTQALVKGTGWNAFLELNRMAFDAALPKNSESRCISVALKLLKKYAPHIKWVVSFADATQCGDGAIYRASGFILTQINKNKTIWQAPDGKTYSDLSLRKGVLAKNGAITGMALPRSIKGASSMSVFKEAGFKPLEGFQLRYVYFLDKSTRKNLTCAEIPFSKIAEVGASMYKGEKY